MKYRRREFLGKIAGAGLLGVLPGGHTLVASNAAAKEAKSPPGVVQFSAELEPLVRLIERTPREKCFEMIVDQLRRGVSYRQFVASLFLAGVRDIRPQPPGFKFHCVFVIHAAHQLSLDARVGDRLLPQLWALDNFKESQERDIKEGDFHLSPAQGSLPAARGAWNEFHSAMETWDEERADLAIITLFRTRGANEIIDGLWLYGARDYRNIGHKAIFVASFWRTLRTIGWQHAEPALRSLVSGLLGYGATEEVNGYAYDDQCYVPNLVLARKAASRLPADWAETGLEAGGTGDILEAIRAGSTDDACKEAARQLTTGQAHASNVWDSAHLAAGELMMRHPGVFGLHAVTSINALHYAFRAAGDRQTRLLILLQATGWMSQFANFMSKSEEFGSTKITDLAQTTREGKSNKDDLREEIFGSLATKRVEAARKAYRLAEIDPDPTRFRRAAQNLLLRKAAEVHDFKYAAAIFEDYAFVSPKWRPAMLATAVYNLRGSEHPDSEVMQQARESLRSLRA